MKTNYQDPGTSEIRSTHIAGMQEALGKLEDSLGMETTAEIGIALSEVYISTEDRYRIFQAPAGKRNWVASPAPVIKKNGVEVTEGFTIDYAGGAIIVSPSALSTDVFTADATYVTAMATSFKSHLADYEQLRLDFDTYKTDMKEVFINALESIPPLADIPIDGVSDAYAAIVARLEYMGYKGELRFPEGTFCISQPIHIGILSDDDGANAFTVDGLEIKGAGNNRTVFNKTTTTLDKSGKDSVFYFNAIRTHVSGIKTTGLGHDSETIGYNLRKLITMSSIKHCSANLCKTGMYLDNVYAGVDIDQFHVSTSKQVFDCSTAEKTAIHFGTVWGENIFKFGYFQHINYSKADIFLCDWANIAAPENTYPTPVTFAETSYGIYHFYLCTTFKIGTLACEHANSRSFVYFGATSFDIDQLHLVEFENTTGSTANNSGKIPIVCLDPNSGVKKCHIGNIQCSGDFSSINTIIYYPYATNTYGSKYEEYLAVDNMPYDIAGVSSVSYTASSSNTDIMVKHQRSKHPIYWDKAIPDATALPYRLKVAVGGAISSEAIAYTYHA